MIAAPVLSLLLLLQSPTTCADVSSCRTAALEAQARKDYEAFHDLAWLAYRKGLPDDADLMLLVARAQSLSGRPSDALVMLQRIASRGIATDAATSEDFARVRALPRWKEIFGPPEASGTATPGATAPATPAPGTSAPPKAPASAEATADRPAGKPAGKPADKPGTSASAKAPSSPPRLRRASRRGQAGGQAGHTKSSPRTRQRTVVYDSSNTQRLRLRRRVQALRHCRPFRTSRRHRRREHGTGVHPCRHAGGAR